jgi:hypothetical protein
MKSGQNYRLVLLISCLAALSLLIGGCGDRNPATTQPSVSPSITATVSSPATTSTPDPAAILARATQGVSAIQDYCLKRYINNSEATRSDNADQVTLLIVNEMVMDSTHRKMQMNVGYSFQGANTAMTENSLYLVDGILYMQGIFPDDPDIWGKVSPPQTYLDTLDQARKLLDLMQSSELTALSPETATSGDVLVACNVLTVNPDLKKLWPLLVDQPGVRLPPGEPQVAYDRFIKKANVKIWLSQDTGVPVNANFDIGLAFDSSIWPSITGTITYHLTIQMSFFNYNQQPMIELPDEAKNAANLDNVQSPAATP